MNIILVMVLLLAFLPGFAMYRHARENSWRRSVTSLIAVTLLMPVFLMLIILLANALMGHAPQLSFDTVTYYFTNSGPHIILFFGFPMLAGLLLGRLAAYISHRKAGS